jgi:hypothetical protein
MGMDHAGDANWSADNAFPSMAQCLTQATSQQQETISNDEWAHAANIAGHATGKPAYITANPGFEEELSHWGVGFSADDVTVGAAYAHTGNLGIRLTPGSFIYSTVVYDPWRLNGTNDQDVAPGMDSTSVTFRIRADLRHAVGSTTGSAQMKLNQREFNYTTATTNCKVSSGGAPGPWLGQVYIGTACPEASTAWATCPPREFVESFPTGSSDARWLRPVVVSTSSSHLYVDRAGMVGGTGS